MECLRDLVGIRGCDAETPSSGMYVNDLEGVPVSGLVSATSDERQTYLQVWEACQNRSLKRIEAEIVKAFADDTELKSVTRMTDLLRRIKPAFTTPAAAVYRGFSVQLTLANTYWVPSNLQVVYLSEFSLYVPSAVSGNVTVKLFDLDSEAELDSFTITDPAAGWKKVTVEKAYSTYRFALVYDSTLIDSVQQNVVDSVADQWIGVVSLIYGSSCSGLIQGCSTQDLTGIADYSNGSNMFGLTAKFSYQCRYDNVVCNNRNLFAYPMLYLMAAELIHACVYGESIHRFNTVDREMAEKLMAEYYGEFSSSLKTTIEGIDIDEDDACVECNEPIQLITSLP